MYQPSLFQKERWWRFIIEADGVDQDGWWFGWCPLHGEPGDTEHPTAQFNFRRDSLRCFAEPSCHDGKRGMTLTNAWLKKEAGAGGQR